jgi:hypothetical protein
MRFRITSSVGLHCHASDSQYELLFTRGIRFVGEDGGEEEIEPGGEMEACNAACDSSLLSGITAILWTAFLPASAAT